MTLRCTLSLLLLLPFAICSILTDFERCKSADFGSAELVCDVDNVLANATKAKLSSLLLGLQERIHCNCEVGCERKDGGDKYIGLLMVTTSQKIEEANKPLNESAKEIYDDAELGNDQCDNGLLIVYIRDKQQLATYRGSGYFILLKSQEMAKLHSMATRHALGDDTLSLQYLLANYENIVMRSEVQRAETLTPVIGLSIALIIVLLVLALLLALFLARFCCCCARLKNKDVYHVTNMPTYKTIEPLFIATPPHSERIHGPHSDVIYSTPYSGTPIPPPHFAAPRPEIYPASVRSASVSQSVTPLSTHKHRIRPAHCPIPRGFTPTGTPTTRSRLGSNRVDDSTQTNGCPPSAEPNRNVERPPSVAIPSGSANFSPRSPDTSSIQRSTGYPESDLSFLDPRRRLEVQTRTDYIY